ncbi:hypothetical protein FUA48_11645 [Flavobacterium alkalisoli]|uniref:Uncharacterized protein n=1 Tax=Flavobacterium alkalisoli TaxID=2602769 RepID=A0A5B9FZK6_9FLAO|nr:hypothetical protein [Flavobacterium alkalisoli]QEE50207.1 hypothetical protein FUA48_11645 [Flavobacterium alkalisoli]
MKIQLTLFFLLLCSFLQAQDIPGVEPFEFQKSQLRQNPYIEELGLDDKNALIIKTQAYSPWSLGKSSSYLVVLTNVKMFKYYRYIHTAYSEDVLKSSEITDAAEKTKLLKLINATTQIKSGMLNITKKDTGEELVIFDAGTCSIEIHQGELMSVLESYAPHEAIEYGYPGAEERQKLLDAANGFNFYDDLFREVIYIEFNDNTQNTSKELKYNNIEFREEPYIREDKFEFDTLRKKPQEIKYIDIKDKLLSKTEANKRLQYLCDKETKEYIKNSQDKRPVPPPYYPERFFSKVYLYVKTDDEKGLFYEVNWRCKALKTPLD